MVIDAVSSAVRQTKYDWLAEAYRGRATDYDITQHRLATYSVTTSEKHLHLSQ